MNVVMVSLLVAVCYSPQVARFDVEAMVKSIPDEAPDEPSLLLQDRPVPIQKEVARQLVFQRKRMRDAVLTLVASGDLLVSGDTDDILQSLGPKLRSQVAPVLVDWMKADGSQRRLLAWYALQNLDAIPDSQIPRLSELAKARSATTRRQVASLLGACGPRAKSEMPVLRRLLGDSRASVRFEACEALLRVDPLNTDALPVLLELLDNTNAGKAEGALDLLPQCPGWFEHAGRIRKSLDQAGRRLEVQHFAWNAKGRQIQLLAEWLGHEASTKVFKAQILRSFSSIDDDATVARDAVLRVAREFDAETRVHAINALRHIGGFDPNELNPSPTDGVAERRAIALALRSCDVKSKSVACSILKEFMADEAKSVRLAACASLSRLDSVSPEVVEFVQARLADGTPKEQIDAMELLPLPGVDNVVFVPSLMKIMEDGERWGTAFAVAELDWMSGRVLADIGKPAIPALLDGLAHSKSSVRRLSAKTLGRIGDSSCTDALFAAIKAEQTEFGSDEEVLRASLRAIADTIEGADDAAAKIPEFVGLLDVDWARASAIRALGTIGPEAKSVVPKLLKLKLPDWGSRAPFEIARALARIQPEGSIGLLGLRRMIKMVGEEGSHSTIAHIDFESTIDLIVELGDSAKPLIPDLAFLVEQHEFLHREHRMQAAYALAHLEPGNPKWRARLEFWASKEIALNPAQERLEQLRKPGEPSR